MTNVPRNFSGLKTKTSYKIRIITEKRVYDKHIITFMYNSNLIWRTVSRLVDEVKQLDHTLVLPHQLDVIQCAGSSYYYNNVSVLHVWNKKKSVKQLKHQAKF